MIKSMTAFAAVEKSDEKEGTVSTEIRTYNSRNLDLSIRLPAGFSILEEKIKQIVGSHLERGRVEIRMFFKETLENTQNYEVDVAKLTSYLTCIEQVKNLSGIQTDIDLGMIVGLPGMIVPTENGKNIEAHWPFMADCLEQALTLVNEMRVKEGSFIGLDIIERIKDIEGRLVLIESESKDIPNLYREKLQARIESLTEGIVTIDPVRIAQEAAFLADRSDISEEIIRVSSHLSQFYAILEDEKPGGRKLNFLLQELNREFNTIGSKSGSAQISHAIVEVKAELEKIREQVQNVE